MILRSAAFLLGNRMGIIKPHQALPVRPVQRKRIVQSVGLLRRRRNLRDRKPDPIAAFGIYHQGEAVQLKQCIERGIVHPHSAPILSL